jgi:hypothetical protein
MKDYFGKRSLLVGMGENHMMLTSCPFEELLREEADNVNPGEEENEESWKVKYEAEWLSSKKKQLFEMPANSLISIHLRNGEAFWTKQQIYQVDLRKIGLQKHP